MDLFDLTEFAPAFLKIADKSGALVPYKFNRAQQYIHERLEAQLKEVGYVRALILKGRQQGVSTYISARFFHKVITNKGVSAFILTHEGEATQNLFEMTKRYCENLPEGLAPPPSKKSHNRLNFDRFDSGYRVGTAGNKNVGRSQTNQLLHESEAAFYKNTTDITQGIEQTVADLPNTEKIKESTANGINNWFYSQWQEAKTGKSEYQAIFVPWYWQDEYKKSAEGMELTREEKDWLELYGKDGLTREHLAWRRVKLGDFEGDESQKCLKFKQEYPLDDEDAFLNSITDTFITVPLVQRARANNIETDANLVIGVDPAISNNDRFAIIRRRGRKAFDLETHYNLNTMEIAAKVSQMIINENPVKVYIDSIGIGAGIVDRLHEMGYENTVVGVNVAHKSDLPDKFKNKRAQLWAAMRAWLVQEMGADIPDDAELQKDLCSLGYSYNTSHQLVIESKKDAAKRGVRSPDLAEALMLTFYDGFNVSVQSDLYNPTPTRTRSMLL